MNPRFGTLTRILSAVFLIAGLGAGIAALTSGHQVTSAARWNGSILLGLSVMYMVIGVGLLIERIWAWWAGAAIAVVTVVLSIAQHSPEGGWVLWLVFLALFAVTGAQGFRERPHPPHGPPR